MNASDDDLTNVQEEVLAKEACERVEPELLAVPAVEVLPAGFELTAGAYAPSLHIARKKLGKGASSEKPAQPATPARPASMVATICERVCWMLLRRGLTGEASHDSNEVRLPEEALDGSRTAALSRGRFEPDPGCDGGDIVSRRLRSRMIPQARQGFSMPSQRFSTVGGMSVGT